MELRLSVRFRSFGFQLPISTIIHSYMDSFFG